MLRMRNKLVFPEIKFVQKDELIPKGKAKYEKTNRPKKVSIYRLDWKSFDAILKDRQQKRKKLKSQIYEKALPEQYECLLENALFALDNDYIQEIQRNCKQAVIEWNTERSFDTIIREICLEPAIAHIRVAFKLLGDCLYDPDTKYFWHKPSQYFIPKAMIYKFWRHQTGGALPQHHAQLNKLKERIDRFDKGEQKEIAAFLKTVKQREKSMIITT